MQFGFPSALQRDRRPSIADDYDPEAATFGRWEDATTIDIEGFIDSTSSSLLRDAVRGQVITDKSLFCTDPNVDVAIGDRIRDGATTYYVRERPAADRNPFTGWQPIIEIPLSNVAG